MFRPRKSQKGDVSDAYSTQVWEKGRETKKPFLSHTERKRLRKQRLRAIRINRKSLQIRRRKQRKARARTAV